MSSPREVANVFAQRAARLDGALSRGIRRGIVATEQEASKLLSGSADAAPGTYPVPVRRGTLRRGLGARQLTPASGMVFNRAAHARAIHEGFRPYGNPRAGRIDGRPFLSDAIEAADPTQYVVAELRQTVFA
jgi:hypothetical protein